MAVAGSGPRLPVVGVSLSRAGLRIGMALLAKATIGIVAVSAVAASTTASETVGGLRRLRLPAWACDLVALTARQLQVLGEELARLRLAGSVRAGTRGRRGQWTAVARSLGVLFVRSVERADRLQVALAARGGPPPPPTHANRRAHASAWLPALAAGGGGHRPPAGRMTDLLLVGHGSRDPAAAAEFAQLTALVRAAAAPGTRVGAGFLELAEPHVDAALDRLVADGATDVAAVPYVLFGAGHLKDDGPAVLARARRRHPDVRFRLGRDLGIHPAVLDVAEDRARTALKRLPPTERTAVVLVGRGSTDPDACADFVKFARLLEDGRGLGPVHPAFVAMSRPHLDDALDQARGLGAEAVTVVPLLLFGGVLVDRIGAQAAAWADAHPDVAVAVAAHLGPDPRLADLVVERHREADAGDVRMNCDVCAYRVRLPGYEEKVGTPLSISPPDGGPPWLAGPAGRQPGRGRRRHPKGTAPPRPGPPHRHPRRPRAGATSPPSTSSASATGGPTAPTPSPGSTSTSPGASGSPSSAPTGRARPPSPSTSSAPSAGRPAAADVDVTGLPVVGADLAEVRRRVGLVFQDPDDQLLLPTVADDVALGPANLGLTGDALAARVATALDVVGLTDAADRAPQHLSMGERRRAALAGVLAVHPEVLVLDEPSANLDPSARRDVVEIVKGLRRASRPSSSPTTCPSPSSSAPGRSCSTGAGSWPTAPPPPSWPTPPSWPPTAWSCPTGSRCRPRPNGDVTTALGG